LLEALQKLAEREGGGSQDTLEDLKGSCEEFRRQIIRRGKESADR
jgi:hypothetical protein